MIDTGCQVTILSTTIFERMCVVDPTVGSEFGALPSPVGISRFVSLDGTGSAGVGHCFSRIVL